MKPLAAILFTPAVAIYAALGLHAAFFYGLFLEARAYARRKAKK